MMEEPIEYGDAANPFHYPYDESIDLCITDPPFKPKYKQYKQIRKDSKNKLDEIPTPTNAEYNLWWLNVIRNIHRALKPGGYLIFKSDDYTARELYETTKTLFDYRGSIVWDKKAIGLGHTIRKQHELLEVYVKLGKKPYFMKKTKPSNKMKIKNLDDEVVEYTPKQWHGNIPKVGCLSSIVTMLPIKMGMLGSDKQKHINQTPPELWTKIIPFFAPIGGFILDPFAGTGSIRQAINILNKYQSMKLRIYDFDINGVNKDV